MACCATGKSRSASHVPAMSVIGPLVTGLLLDVLGEPAEVREDVFELVEQRDDGVYRF